MSNNTPIGRVKFKHEGVNYSVITFWRGDKGISVSLDKNSDKYPAMNPLIVLKKWANGEGFLNYYPAEQQQQRPQTIDGPRTGGGDFGAEDPFGDLPF
jgi:hypothetical protein